MKYEIDGHWVECRDYSTFGDIEMIQKSDVTPQEVCAYFIDEVIIDWDLVDHRGNPHPLDSESCLKRVSTKLVADFFVEWKRDVLFLGEDLKES